MGRPVACSRLCPPHGVQEVPELSTRAVLLLHHTDCGAQAAMRHHGLLVARMRQLLGQYGLVTWLAQV